MTINRERRISDSELNASIAEFAPMDCWKVGLHYGSWIYFEMKDKILRKTRSGEDDWSGSAYLSVIDLGGGWDLYERDVEVVSADDIDRDFAETVLAEKFVGKDLLGFDFDTSRRRLSIHFSGELEIRVSQDAGAGSEADDLMTLFLPDGQIVGFTKSDGLFRHDEQATRWREPDNDA